MRNVDARLRKLEAATGKKPIATIWWDEQSEAELQAEIAERGANGFRVVVVSWQREKDVQDRCSRTRQ